MWLSGGTCVCLWGQPWVLSIALKKITRIKQILPSPSQDTTSASMVLVKLPESSKDKGKVSCSQITDEQTEEKESHMKDSLVQRFPTC